MSLSNSPKLVKAGLVILGPGGNVPKVRAEHCAR